MDHNNLIEAQAEDWRTDIENAPKDGSEIIIPIAFIARAFWCDDLKRWVLSRPLHLESVATPKRFKLPRPIQVITPHLAEGDPK